MGRRWVEKVVWGRVWVWGARMVACVARWRAWGCVYVYCVLFLSFAIISWIVMGCECFLFGCCCCSLLWCVCLTEGVCSVVCLFFFPSVAWGVALLRLLVSLFGGGYWVIGRFGRGLGLVGSHQAQFKPDGKQQVGGRNPRKSFREELREGKPLGRP